MALLELKDQHVLVVGAGQGIGRATALSLAEVGARLSLVDTEAGRAAAVRQEIEAAGSEAIDLVADVTNPEEAARIVSEANAAFGGAGLDAVANIVGQASWAPLLEVDEATWERDFLVNLKQHLYVSRSAVRSWIDTDRPGSICVVASASGRASAARHGAYGAAKAGLLNFVQTAAEEWWPHRVRVNAVVPGAVRTPRIEASWEDGRVPRPTDDLLDRMALPEDIGHAIVFLLSDLARKITGQSIVVDGGWTTRFPYGLN
jgi:3-oxoacyl-[acyl-carrier protein] reductase